MKTLLFTRVVKRSASAILCLSATYALFLYVAHFTAVQSVVLAIISLFITNAYFLVSKVAVKYPPSFVPFWVVIQPKWPVICKDFSLCDVQDWDAVWERHTRFPKEISIYNSAINFTVLQPTLIYFDDQQRFVGGLDFRIPIPEFRVQCDESLGKALFGANDHILSTSNFKENHNILDESSKPSLDSPHFYIRQSIAKDTNKIPVIEFGIISEDSLRKMMFERVDAHVCVAQLPKDVLRSFSTDETDYDLNQNMSQWRKMRLAAFGWTDEERQIEHKYLTITYRTLL